MFRLRTRIIEQRLRQRAGFPRRLSGKASPYNAGATGDLGSIPGLGKSPEGGHSSPLQSSCLENPMDRGAWRAAVHGVTKSQTGLKRLSTNACKKQPKVKSPLFCPHLLTAAPSAEKWGSQCPPQGGSVKAKRAHVPKVHCILPAAFYNVRLFWAVSNEMPFEQT